MKLEPDTLIGAVIIVTISARNNEEEFLRKKSIETSLFTMDTGSRNADGTLVGELTSQKVYRHLWYGRNDVTPC